MIKTPASELTPPGQAILSASGGQKRGLFADKQETLRKLKLRKKPAWLPPFWLKVTDGRGARAYRQKRDWSLALDAMNIPYFLSVFAGQIHFYAPPLLAMRARREIAAVQKESLPVPAPPSPRVFRRPYFACLLLLPILLIDLLRNDRRPLLPFLPPPERWLDLGCVDAFKVLVEGQWYRVTTALGLHASLVHLSGNLFFGAIFLTLLGRVTGYGCAMFLTVFGGSLANALCLRFRGLDYRSLGFSTALFAAIGALAGMAAMTAGDRKKALFPLAAALALLALLGTEGDNTDYGAHVAGVVCGAILGALYGWRESSGRIRAPQWLAALLALALFIGAWVAALT